MALANTVTGDGILVSYDAEVREYDVVLVLGSVVRASYRETKATEIRQWVALTKAAAEGKAQDPATPPEGTTYSYAVAETNRVLKAYMLTRTAVTESLEFLGTQEEEE